jgi:ADP-ribosyl-[dinitrogen reductase] hydrolase
VPETAEQYEFVRRWQPLASLPNVGRQADRPADRAPTVERFRGCLLGLAAGDTAATGGWSDETGMTNCVAESLLANWGFDARDQLLRYGLWAQDPVSRGAVPGATLRPPVTAALTRSLRSHAPVGGSHDPRMIDPSPLVRAAAAAMFSARNPNRAMSLAADTARVTHQVPRVVDTCRLFALLLTSALTGADKAGILEAANARWALPLHEEVAGMARLWSAAPGGRRPRQPGILGCLDAAVRAFLRTASFEAGLARLRDSGPDPDATMAAYGALAGAHYGDAVLPEAIGQAEPARARLVALAEQLFRAASAR